MGRSVPDIMVKRLLGVLPAVAVILGVGMLISSLLRANSVPAGGAATPGEDPPTLIVVIDAGHGGVDGGAVGVATGVVEAELNLQYAYALKAELEARGMTVVMTRTDENALASGKKSDMAARKKIMNGCGADIVVSIHMNKFTDRSVCGPMAFYEKGSEEGKLLAAAVITGVCEGLERRVRLASPADYYIVRESDMPAVLVECGFLSNASDEALVQTDDYRDALVRGIADAVEFYFGIPAQGPPAG